MKASDLNLVAVGTPAVAVSTISCAQSLDTDTENTHQDDKLFLKSTGFNEPQSRHSGSSLLVKKPLAASKKLTASHVVPE